MSETTKIDDGGPAFPMHERDDALCGMSLRDYFAAKAMQGFLAAAGKEHMSAIASGRSTVESTSKGLAEGAYNIADAMLAARKK